MKKIILLILIFTQLNSYSNKTDIVISKYSKKVHRNEVFDFIKSKQDTIYRGNKFGYRTVYWLNDDNANKITDFIIKNSEKYNCDALIAARQLWKETAFKWWEDNYLNEYNNKKYKIHGIGQINLRYWSHLLYHVQDSKYKDLLNSLDKKDRQDKMVRLSKDLEIGIELRFLVMKHYKKMFKGNYSLALVSYYAGENSKQMKQFKDGKSFAYVDYILGE